MLMGMWRAGNTGKRKNLLVFCSVFAINGLLLCKGCIKILGIKQKLVIHNIYILGHNDPWSLTGLTHIYSIFTFLGNLKMHFSWCFSYRQAALWGVAISAPHPLAHTHVSPLLRCMNYFLFWLRSLGFFIFFPHFLGVFCKWAGRTGCDGWIGGGGWMLWGAWPVAFSCAPCNWQLNKMSLF